MPGVWQYYIPATVNRDVWLTRNWFLHTTVVSLLLNELNAVTCRVEVKFLLKPISVVLVKVAVKGGIEVVVFTGSDVKVIGLISGLFHWRENDRIIWQVKVTISPSQAYCLPFSSTVDVSITLPATEMKSIHLEGNHSGMQPTVCRYICTIYTCILNKIEDTSQNLPKSGVHTVLKGSC